MAKLSQWQGSGSYSGIARFLHTKEDVDSHMRAFVNGLKLEGGVARLKQEVDKFARGLYDHIDKKPVEVKEALERYFIKVGK